MSGTVVEKFFVQNDVENTLVTLIKPRLGVDFALDPFLKFFPVQNTSKIPLYFQCKNYLGKTFLKILI